jgi:murein L,D-transpeptidase YafK
MRRRHAQRRVVAATCVVLAWCAPGSCAPKKEPLQADRVVVAKSRRTLTLLRHGKVLKTYKVALGGEPRGPKTQRGDNKTPEGLYTIDARNPRSQFHLALHVSYPNAADRERARKLGVDPGGAIMIHGLPSAFAYLGPLHRQTDWTLGCVAVTNSEIEEIWSMVPVGTAVEIKP